MSTFVLIHGSLIGGWCWNKIKKTLEGDGHTVFAPDLPGHSLQSTIAASGITLEKYVTFVCNLVNGIDGKIVLVGHSLGGAIITKAVEQLFSKVERLIYVCAIVPKNGDKVGELMVGDSSSEVNDSIQINKEKMQIEVDVDKIDGLLFNGCDNDDIAYAKKMIVPQPFLPFLEPIMLEKEFFKNIDRIGVVCTDDKSLSPAIQEKMYNDAACKKYYLDSGHAPYFSKADELAKILLECV